jgi:hypothetical protein
VRMSITLQTKLVRRELMPFMTWIRTAQSYEATPDLFLLLIFSRLLRMSLTDMIILLSITSRSVRDVRDCWAGAIDSVVSISRLEQVKTSVIHLDERLVSWIVSNNCSKFLSPSLSQVLSGHRLAWISSPFAVAALPDAFWKISS